MEPNMVWMFTGRCPTKDIYILCYCWSEVHKRNKRPKGVKKSLFINMGIHFVNNILFICFLWGFFKAFLSEPCITLKCNYYCFWHTRGRGGVKYFNAVFCSVHLYKLLMDHSFFCAILFRKGARKFAYLKGISIFFYFSSNFDVVLVVGWIVLRAFSSMLADFLYPLRSPI